MSSRGRNEFEDVGITASAPVARATSYGYGNEKDEKDLKGASDDNATITGVPDIPEGGVDELTEKHARADMEVTQEDMLALEKRMATMTLDRTRLIMAQLAKMHEHDQNFPQAILERIHTFLNSPEIFEQPDKHREIIQEMKLEALLVTENSPYAEVRAVVDNTDDPDMPSFTVRTWVIGIVFCGIGAAINQLFSIRQPPIYITSEVAQLLAFPAGKAMEKLLPAWNFRFFGQHSLNPGPFNKKEHMLITIMATVAFNTPYTTDIIVSQYLPQYFNQSYAAKFGYQILAGLGTNFCGYGLAGLGRRFLIAPSYCVWPASLVTIALNQAFHSTDADSPVPGPFNRIYTWTRMRFFTVMFVAMFVYFFFPGFIFQALSIFNWISWIAPNNQVLNNITGMNHGLGLNPWPTFDFNILIAWIQSNYNPLVMPAFTTINIFIGMLLSFFMSAAFFWTNAWNTGYIPINTNHIYDNTGSPYNISQAIDSRGIFDNEKYQQYSMPWMSAGNLTVYFWFFAQYTSAIGYAVLFHRHEIALGFTSMWRQVWHGGKRVDEDDLTEDVHARLMKSYKEAPEWWYLIVLLIAMGCGMAGIGSYDTYTSPAVVLFGIALALIFIVPLGLINAITGIQVTMNVLAELIGGAITPGNALSMNYFKAYGYITTAQALYFLNDLKIAHYLKIPPRHTFFAQVIATLVSTFICTGILTFQLNGISGVCTADAPFEMTCPGINTFFTAAVFWGTIGPKKVFGSGPYKALLIGFPVGLLLPIGTFVLRKWFPRSRLVRNLHPAIICFGALSMAPYNLSYIIPAVYMALISWVYIRGRYLAFWSKYNFVLAAAWTSGIAIAAIVIFFALQIPNVAIDWWGNNVSFQGCEDTACVRFEVPDGGYFGPAPGTFP